MLYQVHLAMSGLTISVVNNKIHCWLDWFDFQQYIGDKIVVSYFGGGNQSTWRKQQTCLFKSLTKQFHIVVIVTDYLGSCKFDNHVVLAKLWSQSWQHHVDPYFEVILTSDWDMKNNNKSTKSTVLQCFVYQSFIWIVFHVQSLLLCISFHVFYSFYPKLIVI